MEEGIVLHESAFQDTKTIKLNKIIIPDEDIKAIKESKAFRILLDSFEEIRLNYISVVDLHDGNYKLIDGLQRYLIYRDYLHINDIKAAVLRDIDFNMDDLRFTIRSSQREKGLIYDIKRSRIASKFVNREVLNENHTKAISHMLGMSTSNVYRLSNIEKNVKPKLLNICLERDISVRAAEAITSITMELQDALYEQLLVDKSLKPTEQLVKTIKYRDRVTADYEPGEETSIAGRTLGRARRDRKIIEDAIQFDLQKGIAIKDVDNISSKIVISNLIGKQEDAVKALENRIYKINHHYNTVEVSRIRNVIQRLDEIADYMCKHFQQ